MWLARGGVKDTRDAMEHPLTKAGSNLPLAALDPARIDVGPLEEGAPELDGRDVVAVRPADGDGHLQLLEEVLDGG